MTKRDHERRPEASLEGVGQGYGVARVKKRVGDVVAVPILRKLLWGAVPGEAFVWYDPDVETLRHVDLGGYGSYTVSDPGRAVREFPTPGAARDSLRAHPGFAGWLFNPEPPDSLEG